MSYLQQLISNSVLITALIGWFAAQVLKMILVWDKKKFDFKRIIGSGGMPSSHSSFVMALTMSIGFTQGFDSVVFAISAACGGEPPARPLPGSDLPFLLRGVPGL